MNYLTLKWGVSCRYRCGNEKQWTRCTKWKENVCNLHTHTHTKASRISDAKLGNNRRRNHAFVFSIFPILLLLVFLFVLFCGRHFCSAAALPITRAWTQPTDRMLQDGSAGTRAPCCWRRNVQFENRRKWLWRAKRVMLADTSRKNIHSQSVCEPNYLWFLWGIQLVS